MTPSPLGVRLMVPYLLLLRPSMKRILSLLIIALFSTGMIAESYGKYRNDTDLAGLYIPAPGSTWSTNPQTKLTSHEKYRNLMSQLGVVFAPVFLSPAETLGYMGHALGVNYSLTTIDSKAVYWKEGMEGTPGFAMQTIGFEYRKGMWFPLPGFEIGGGLKYLPDSHMYAPHIMAKFSINEGYFKLPIPAIAVRGYGARVMGNTDVDLTIASVDVSLSKSFGLLSTVNATVYAGYNYLMIIPDSKVIDFTPGIDSLRQDDTAGTTLLCNNSSEPDCANNDVFEDQGVINRHSIFAGVRFIYYHTFITAEVIMSMDGSSTGEVINYISGTPQTVNVKDSTAKQFTFSLAFGWNY